MSKFFNDQNPIAGFEDYISKQTKKTYNPNDAKEYESIKTYNFLEYNYYRLKKLAKLLHKKIYNLGSDEYFEQTLDDYKNANKENKNFLNELLSDESHPFQKRQEEIYHHFFTRK